MTSKAQNVIIILPKGNRAKAQENKKQEEKKMTREQELAAEIRSSQEWDFDQLRELCELADMESEWESADGETFEQVAFQAAEKLGVEIM